MFTRINNFFRSISISKRQHHEQSGVGSREAYDQLWDKGYADRAAELGVDVDTLRGAAGEQVARTREFDFVTYKGHDPFFHGGCAAKQHYFDFMTGHPNSWGTGAGDGIRDRA
jgi:hypothetical protein